MNKKIIHKFSNLFLILTIILTTFYYEKFVKIRRFNDIFHDVSNYVIGSEIDYVTELGGSYLAVVNPTKVPVDIYSIDAPPPVEICS